MPATTGRAWMSRSAPIASSPSAAASFECDRRLQGVAADHDRGRPAGAARGAARQRRLLPCAGRRSGDWPRLSASDDRVEWAERRHSERRAVAAALRRRSGDRRPRRSRSTANVTVIGVMPPTFENVPSPAAELWAPLQYDSSLPPRAGSGAITCAWSAACGPIPIVGGAARELDAIAKVPVPSFVRAPWAALPRGFRRELAAGRRHARRQAGAARRHRRGDARAGDRLRERDQPAARARRAAARRVRDARRARRRAPPDHPAAAHREPAARRASAAPSALLVAKLGVARWWR